MSGGQTGCGADDAGVATVVYEDRPYDRSLQSQLRVHISVMVKTLKAVDALDIIVRKRNFIAVDTNRFDCDYYQFLDGDVPMMNAFTGEYMLSYSWAELTTGRLSRKNFSYQPSHDENKL